MSQLGDSRLRKRLPRIRQVSIPVLVNEPAGGPVLAVLVEANVPVSIPVLVNEPAGADRPRMGQ